MLRRTSTASAVSKRAAPKAPLVVFTARTIFSHLVNANPNTPKDPAQRATYEAQMWKALSPPVKAALAQQAAAAMMQLQHAAPQLQLQTQKRTKKRRGGPPIFSVFIRKHYRRVAHLPKARRFKALARMMRSSKRPK